MTEIMVRMQGSLLASAPVICAATMVSWYRPAEYKPFRGLTLQEKGWPTAASIATRQSGTLMQDPSSAAANDTQR